MDYLKITELTPVDVNTVPKACRDQVHDVNPAAAPTVQYFLTKGGDYFLDDTYLALVPFPNPTSEPEGALALLSLFENGPWDAEPWLDAEGKLHTAGLDYLEEVNLLGKPTS